jgi:hypothetical protein
MKTTETQSRHSVQRIVGCKHRGSWIIGGGSYEWCFECGAFRGLKQHGPQSNMVAPCSPWVHPSGIGGENPHEKWCKAKERWERDHTPNDKIRHGGPDATK